jgi:hypothetical protein
MKNGGRKGFVPLLLNHLSLVPRGTSLCTRLAVRNTQHKLPQLTTLAVSRNTRQRQTIDLYVMTQSVGYLMPNKNNACFPAPIGGVKHLVGYPYDYKKLFAAKNNLGIFPEKQ